MPSSAALCIMFSRFVRVGKMYLLGALWGRQNAQQNTPEQCTYHVAEARRTRVHDQGDNEAVQTQNFSENEDKDLQSLS